MGNPFEDLRQAVVVRPMNSPGPQGAAGPEVKIKYSFDGLSWHDTYMESDKYIRFSTDNGVTWSEAIYFNNLYETLAWVDKARRWAINPEDLAVEPGKYSALHYASKAENAAINAAANAEALIEPSIERARQWAENPENVPVIEPDQFSALHHASRAARSEENAEAAALDAELAAIGAFGVPPAPWNSTTVYNYNDIVNFGNGHIYRCIGTNIVGADHAPNIDGIDNEEDWVRITVILDGYFEVDENGDFMPMIAPTNSEIFMLDENSDITYQDPIELDASRATIELFTLDENGDIAYRDLTDHRPGGGNIELYKEMEFVDSIADFRTSHFQGTTKYVYVLGYYGKGTPGGGMFYKDIESQEDDNSGTIIIDGDGIRWKRANVHGEYYASWFGVSTHLDDNSPLIQNALNNMKSGDILIFGPGTYYCKQTITLPHFKNSYYGYVGITLQGVAKTPSYPWGFNAQTTLRYSGPSRSVPTPFLDFRLAYPTRQYFRGSIRNIYFEGWPNGRNNVVCIWLHTCVGSLFESVAIGGFACGIQIDHYYFYSKFNDLLFMSCGSGFRGLGVGNMAVFNYCNFRTSTIGLETNGWICLNSCYFENNNTAIKLFGSNLYLDKCYFEGNSKYIIDIDSNTSNGILVLSNSIMNLYALDLTPPNKAAIDKK